MVKSTDLNSTEQQILLSKQPSEYKNHIKNVIRRSNYPQIRNSLRPSGEIYATILFTPDYVIKLIDKPNWGGKVLTITTWELLVIDIDLNFDVKYIIDMIDKSPHRLETFRIRKTSKGYHLYLMSRAILHSSKEAIKIRQDLGCDPAYGANSLYTGCSIRLNRKIDDKLSKASEYITDITFSLEKYIDPHLQSIYNKIDQYVDEFSKYDVHSFNDPLVLKHLSDMNNINNNLFGYQQILVSSPASIKNVLIEYKFVIHNDFIIKHNIIDRKWEQFLKHKVIHGKYLPAYFIKIHTSIGYCNLYRILEMTEDYAIGVHTQESLHFIVYRDLLMVDYDDPSKLRIIYNYCRYHRTAKFRCVKTPKGYHVFLTSSRVNHQSTEALNLLMRLCSDPCHLLGVPYRGYSVRVNQKHRNEVPYIEMATIGYGQEDPELVSLYQKHLDLYRQNVNNKNIPLFNIQQTVCKEQYEKFLLLLMN